MKNSFIIKKIRQSLLKQIIFPIALLALCLLTLKTTVTGNYLSPVPIREENHFEAFYNPEAPYVKLAPDTLHATGYDYMVNGKRKGHYYYTLADGFCQFYVIKGRPGAAFATALEKPSLKGRLIRLEDNEYLALCAYLAEDLQWTKSSIEAMSSPYAFTDINLFTALDITFWSILGICAFLSSFDILCSALFILFPLLSPTFRHLGKYGEARTLLSKVEMEMRHTLLAKAANIYLTPNYIVNVDTIRSVILPMESVLWVYYHGHMRHLFGISLNLSYTLHVVTKDGRLYEFSKKKKENLDYILNIMEKRSPDILIGYTEQNKQTAKQQLPKRKQVRL